MKKKTGVLSLLLVFILVLAACGNGNDKMNGGSSKSSGSSSMAASSDSSGTCPLKRLTQIYPIFLTLQPNGPAINPHNYTVFGRLLFVVNLLCYQFLLLVPRFFGGRQAFSFRKRCG